MEENMQSTRTSFPRAVKTVLDTMEKKRMLSMNALSRETGLNRRTVEKALKLLLEIQPYFLSRKLKLVEMNRTKLIEIIEKSGLLELPENIQRLIIRTAYYPIPSKEEMVLIHMCLKESLSPETSMSLEKDEIIQKLVKQGQILETERALRFYLSDEGKIVAEGALRLYPELKEL